MTDSHRNLKTTVIAGTEPVLVVETMFEEPDVASIAFEQPEGVSKEQALVDFLTDNYGPEAARRGLKCADVKGYFLEPLEDGRLLVALEGPVSHINLIVELGLGIRIPDL
jgi:hypothetical protein